MISGRPGRISGPGRYRFDVPGPLATLTPTGVCVPDGVGVECAQWCESLRSLVMVRFRVCVPDGVQVLADKRLTKQILINLLSNAIKFTPNGGTITVGAEKGRGQGLEIYVADTGIGMDAAQLEKAFSPYGQINSQIAQVHQGTGLGLPIAQSMARLQGGDVVAQSTPGHGTRMTLILPESRIVEPAEMPQLVAQSA